jgi:phospholipid/cholesterol/gamma-HCH transport system substrate-binding protein
MRAAPLARITLAAVLVITAVVALVQVVRWNTDADRTQIIGYFDNSNGIFVGDDVRILGVNVGKVTRIEAQPDRVKINFWVDGKYQLPADAGAVIVAPAVVSARAIQLTPPYTTGPTMSSGAVIPPERTAVPVEWDDFRKQLKTLSDTLQPTQPGGASTLGALINTAADNLRGQGPNIRDTLIKLSAAFSALGDHSGDIFATVKNLSIVVSALSGSTDLMRQLNINLASVSALLVDDPNEVSAAVDDFSTAVGDVNEFVEQNRDAIGIASDKLTSISQTLAEMTPDLKQTLHILPNTLQNFANIYHPAQGGIAGTAVLSFASPITYVCGAIQAASRLGAEQSAKLCAQYLAPIVKNRQYNFPPIGTTINPLFLLPVTGATARPNEITYSEDWMRPDYNPATAPADGTLPPPAGPVSGTPETASSGTPAPGNPLPAEAPVTTDPSQGLPGLMVPPGQP